MQNNCKLIFNGGRYFAQIKCVYSSKQTPVRAVYELHGGRLLFFLCTVRVRGCVRCRCC